MNYSQKRTLIGRVIYIALTVMAVTVLCVTLYTFFGTSKRQDNNTPVTDASDTSGTHDTAKKDPDVSSQKPDKQTEPPVIEPVDTGSAPTDVDPEKDWSKVKLTPPTQGIISKKHDPKNAVFSLTMNDYRVHSGIDISCAVGDEVYACADGTVKMIGSDPFMGMTVIIDHGDGLVSYYRNLDENVPDSIEVGAVVAEGQIIGCVGETALIEISDEPHLHFELELSGVQLDPLSMMNYDETAATALDAEADK